MIDTILLDADDTLWESQAHFDKAEAAMAELLSPWAEAPVVDERLLAIARQNIAVWGYGVKSFVLTSLETAADLIGGDVPAEVQATILDLGRTLMTHPVELLDGVYETVESLSSQHRLIIVTKGDNQHQRRKIAASGLEAIVNSYEIVIDKTVSAYHEVLTRHGLDAERTIMIGNSLASDVVPALDAGLHAAHIPHTSIWAHEDITTDDDRIVTLASIRDVPEHVASLQEGTPS